MQQPALLHLLACFSESGKLHSVVHGVIGLQRLHGVGMVGGGVARVKARGMGGSDCDRVAWHELHFFDKQQPVLLHPFAFFI